MFSKELQVSPSLLIVGFFAPLVTFLSTMDFVPESFSGGPVLGLTVGLLLLLLIHGIFDQIDIMLRSAMEEAGFDQDKESSKLKAT